MNLRGLAGQAVGYSKAMDNLAGMAASDPTIVQDAGRLAQFQTEFFYAQSGFQLVSKSIQDIHREDQSLAEMLRDA